MVLVGVGVEEKLAFMSVNYYFALNKDRVEVFYSVGVYNFQTISVKAVLILMVSMLRK